ncbi:site-specific DNA-methyltransferase (adenine-specific) [Thermanaeromonas toyohensis ToBE]|uniref:Site-specific DNA-methyltransferase (Adenine-specific) n=1 Tax=Thermanaeromonas toyohensis ToBE TaxID=698762 RepID=A0A1W1VS11_9FIRM|nr:DNA methyltransferase [Thermanaeromonas toyohensis]SMB96172.1 site-specific DNA-methyltransferase (adenine-specific) [Thermanaeromonas toyohensis ToBE]
MRYVLPDNERMGSKPAVRCLARLGKNGCCAAGRVGRNVAAVFSNTRHIETFPDCLQNSIYQYDYPNRCDGRDLLRAIRDASVPCAFFDPQYRGVLDRLAYGNEGRSRCARRSFLPQMSEETIKEFISEIARVLIPSGHLFLWVDKFHLCEGVSGWLPQSLQVVDMIVWNKLKMGMGYRTRRQCEYLLVIQKRPIRAKGVWAVHDIPDVWEEKAAGRHPHAKPVGLQKRLIEAVTNAGDVVVDPAAGGYSVLEACRLSGRRFLGGDLVYGV